MEIKIELNDFLLYQVAFVAGVMSPEVDKVPLDLLKVLHEGQLEIVKEVGTEDFVIEMFEAIAELKEQLKQG